VTSVNTVRYIFIEQVLGNGNNCADNDHPVTTTRRSSTNDREIVSPVIIIHWRIRYTYTLQNNIILKIPMHSPENTSKQIILDPNRHFCACLFELSVFALSFLSIASGRFLIPFIPFHHSFSCTKLGRRKHQDQTWYYSTVAMPFLYQTYEGFCEKIRFDYPTQRRPTRNLVCSIYLLLVNRIQLLAR
jgi:hypothetical protein